MIKFLALIWITTISLATEFDFKLSNNSYLELSCQDENPIKNLYFKSKSKQLKVIDKFHCFNTSNTGLIYEGLFHAVKVTPILDRPYPEQKVEGWWENNKNDTRICGYNLKVENNTLTAELKQIKTENIKLSRKEFDEISSSKVKKLILAKFTFKNSNHEIYYQSHNKVVSLQTTIPNLIIDKVANVPSGTLEGYGIFSNFKAYDLNSDGLIDLSFHYSGTDSPKYYFFISSISGYQLYTPCVFEP